MWLLKYCSIMATSRCCCRILAGDTNDAMPVGVLGLNGSVLFLVGVWLGLLWSGGRSTLSATCEDADAVR